MNTPSFVCKVYPAKNPTRVLFFFTGFKTKTWHFSPVYRQLNQLGYTVVSYQFPGRALLYVDSDFLDNLRYMLRADVHEKIAAYKKQGIKEFASLCVSMGSVFCVGIAKHTPEIKRMVILTIYGSGAMQIWQNPRLAKMKKLYTDQGITMEQLAKEHEDAEAAQNIQKLSGKSILLYASRGDTSIRFHNTELFIDAAKQAGLDIEVVIGTGNHLPFIAKTLLRSKRWIEFLS